jgi:hypothetical protein
MEIVRNAVMPGMTPKRGKWPFKDLNVGDMVKFKIGDPTFPNPQSYAFTYAAKTGKKFTTRTVGQEVHVYRIG